MICRLCLIDLNSENSVEIFDELGSNNQPELQKLITHCLHVDITWSDEISTVICDECYKNLNEFHKYCAYIREQQIMLSNKEPVVNEDLTVTAETTKVQIEHVPEDDDDIMEVHGKCEPTDDSSSVKSGLNFHECESEAAVSSNMDLVSSAISNQSDQSSRVSKEGESDVVPKLDKKRGPRRRLRRPQKKVLQKLLAGGVPYNTALERVLELPKTSTLVISVKRRNESGIDSSVPPAKNSRPQVADTIPVGIVPHDFPDNHLEPDEQKAVKNEIFKKLQDLTVGGPQIRFFGCTQKYGWLEIICKDIITHDWLAAKIVTITSSNKTKLRMAEIDHLEKPYIATAHFPDKTTNAEEILRVLRIQNRSLPTQDWKVLWKVKYPNGLVVKISMDEDSAKLLENLELSPFYDMDRVHFKLKKNPYSQPFSSAMLGGGWEQGRND